ncbi:hypothetical protein ACJX0J_009238, partial [Zea mays]
ILALIAKVDRMHYENLIVLFFPCLTRCIFHNNNLLMSKLITYYQLHLKQLHIFTDYVLVP